MHSDSGPSCVHSQQYPERQVSLHRHLIVKERLAAGRKPLRGLAGTARTTGTSRSLNTSSLLKIQIPRPWPDLLDQNLRQCALGDSHLHKPPGDLDALTCGTMFRGHGKGIGTWVSDI